MEVKDWTYSDFPDYLDRAELPAGADVVDTTGNEVGIAYHHDIPYVVRGDVELHLQVLVPSMRNSHLPHNVPCLVYVQGSAWKKQYCYREVCQLARLAARGIVIAVVEYRDSSIAFHPAQVHDAQVAVAFMRDHAGEYGIDPDEIVIGGNSSGGHTAVFTPLIAQEDGTPASALGLRGVIDQYGAASLMHTDGYPTTTNGRLPDSPEGMLMGGVNLHEHPELCRSATAVEHIDAALPYPPALIVHGTHDRIVNTSLSVELYEHLRATGHEAELILLRGADHGGSEFWSEKMIDTYERFIRRCCS